MEDRGLRIAILHLLFSIFGVSNRFVDDSCHHLYESRMIIRAACANQIHSQISGDLLRIDIEIVKHFDVVADEADGRDDDLFVAIRGMVPNGLANLRLEPRICRSAAAALIGERPARMLKLRSDQTRARFNLFNVG